MNIKKISIYGFLGFATVLFTITIAFASSLVYYTDDISADFQSYISSGQRYSLMDNYLDPTDFKAAINEVETINDLADFYNGLNASDSLTALSIFIQPIFIKGFAGDSRFYANSQAFIEENPEVEVGIQAVQLNKTAFDYYHLEVAGEAGFDWQAVDYQAGDTLPILLGSAYQEVYQVGDVIAGEFYFKNFNFEVVGFLKPNSFIYYQTDPEFYLDKYMLIPYPEKLWQVSLEGFDFESILYFAMINMDIVSQGTHKEFIREIKTVSDQSHFADFSVVNVDDFLIQYLDLILIFEKNKFLLLGLLGLLGILLHVMIYGSFVLLQNVNKKKNKILHILGSLSYIKYQSMALLCLSGLMVVTFVFVQYRIFEKIFPSLIILHLLLESALTSIEIKCLKKSIQRKVN